MCRKIAISIVICLVTLGNSISFRRVAEIPYAAWYKPLVFDTDQDGKQNLIICKGTPSPFAIRFWEHANYDRYFLEDSAVPLPLCDIGFLDTDSLVDMVANLNGTGEMYVYESPTQNSHPTNVVWQDTGLWNCCLAAITDLDQDGLREILVSDIPHTYVYENMGDNQYSVVWDDSVNCSVVFVNDDFDLDNRIEFASSNYSIGQVLVWECIGDNDYQLVFSDTLPWPNNSDIFSGNDMDGNSKPEFLFVSVHYFLGITWLYLYEAVGDNNYDFFLVDSITGIPGAMLKNYSTCGDIDADGAEEIIWSTFNQWHVYKASGIQQYQKIYSSTWTLHDGAIMSVYDLNENGYPEIIESWEENTIPYLEGIIIWEIEGVRLHQPNGGETLQVGSQYPITWEKFDPPGADSFSLFVSFNNGVDYNPITTIPQPNDTMHLWTVPDSVSDSCKIMIWAYGPPRSGEQEPRGTAWDFSDSVFTIAPQGVEELKIKVPSEFSLKISQNPVLNKNLKIQYTVPRQSNVRLVIYNILGQVEEVLIDKKSDAGMYEFDVDDLQSGIYFVQLQTPDFKETKKVILLR